jgi:hypothetical protein
VAKRRRTKRPTQAEEIRTLRVQLATARAMLAAALGHVPTSPGTYTAPASTYTTWSWATSQEMQ